MRALVGRTEEQEKLRKYYESKRSEFVALFGRRRVGKTFLVKSLFGDEFAFYAAGLQDGDTQTQIQNFNKELAYFGGVGLAPAADWQGAFENLKQLIDDAPEEKKKIVFLDEISWMGASHPSFISALDYFWNRWISARDDVLLIVCGSATSWIIDNIVNNTGGLHNRLTGQIYLAPLTLKECETYFRENGIMMSRYNILEAYMVFGGIPYYLDLFEPGRSLAQNIDRIYFAPGAPLVGEYENLFKSLFKNADNHILVIEALATKRKGLSREEVSRQSGIKGGGTLTKVLSDLVRCGFVREYLAFGKQSRDRLFQLTDPFTLFHLSFTEKQKRYMENFWLHYCTTPAHSAWSGYAFELVCLLHVPQIKRKLGISGVLTEVSSWRSKEGKEAGAGSQIDLVLDRNDQIINLCEMKYASDTYTIDKEYNKKLREKRSTFMSETKTRKAAHITMVTTFGLTQNEYSAEVFFQVTMDDLFLDKQSD